MLFFSIFKLFFLSLIFNFFFTPSLLVEYARLFLILSFLPCLCNFYYSFHYYHYLVLLLIFFFFCINISKVFYIVFRLKKRGKSITNSRATELLFDNQNKIYQTMQYHLQCSVCVFFFFLVYSSSQESDF